MSAPLKLYRRGEMLRARKMNRTVEIVNDLVTRTDQRRMRKYAGRNDQFLAKITGHADITANVKWKYAWTEIVLSTDDDAEAIEPRSGTTTSDYALNLVEMNNTTSGAIGGDGVDPAGADYPANFLRRPIGSQGTSDTHAVDVIVVIFMVYDEDGLKRPVFTQPNAHDGTC